MAITHYPLLDTAIKFGVLKGLAQIPVVGALLSGIAGALWPSSTAHQMTPDDVFDHIKDRINGLITNAITQNNLDRLKTSLKAIGDEINDYQNSSTLHQAQSKFYASRAVILAKIDEFQQPGEEVAMLPLYAQAVNAWLAFLRDGVLSGPAWKLDAAEQKNLESDLASEIKKAVAYTNKIYASGLTDRQHTAAGQQGSQKFNTETIMYGK